MNTTFCPYSSAAPSLHDDDCSSVFGTITASNDIESFLSWDLDTDSASCNTYDIYTASSALSATLPVAAGMANRSPMLSASYAWEQSTSSAIRHSATSTNLQCPTCDCTITCNIPGQTLHGHIVNCFLERHRHRWGVHHQPDQGEGNLSQVQHTISQLDNHTRIRLMQSLYRLSKCQDPVKATSSSSYLHISSSELDDPILKLIYTYKTDGEQGDP